MRGAWESKTRRERGIHSAADAKRKGKQARRERGIHSAVEVNLDSEMRTTEYTEYTDFEWVLRKPSLTLGMNGAPSRASVISVHSVHSVVSVFLLSTRTRACFGVWNVE